MKEDVKQNFQQFINETIEICNYFKHEIEAIKNSPIHQIHLALQQNQSSTDTNQNTITAKLHHQEPQLIQKPKNIPQLNPQHQRKNALSDLIARAQRKAQEEGSDPWDSAKIYSLLGNWADSGLDEYLPLQAFLEEGIEYLDGYEIKYLTKVQLINRLYRLKKSSSNRANS